MKSMQQKFKLRTPGLAAAVLLMSASAIAADGNMEEASRLVQQFAGQLKPALKQALTEGGPVHAISVCAEEAPRIAQELSANSAWTVRRVSLKPRNADSAQPDEWAREVLAKFDADQASGADPASLVHGEMDGHVYRFMRAQPVEPLCLTCHGKAVAPGVADALAKHYPDDRALGYDVGQIRGAFYLTKEME